MRNTFTLYGRLMTHIKRNPDTILTAMIQPILLMLLFVYVFGGAIQATLPYGETYVKYQLPGILIIAVAYNTSYTAFRMFTDRQKGITNRFHSMPIRRSSSLWAHVLASVTSSVFTLAMTFAVGFLMGFRTGAGVVEWLLVIAVLILLSLTLTWIAVIPGLIAKSPDAAQFFAFPIIFLPTISSAFAPTETMPKALRVFAENQPMTPIVETVRKLLNNEPAGNELWLAIAWCVGIMALAWFFAMKAYKRRVA